MDTNQIEKFATRVGGAIEMHADQFPVLIALRGSRSGTARTDKDDRPKTNPAGQATYSVDADVIGVGFDGEIQVLRNVYVNSAAPVTEKFNILDKTFLRAAGRVWLTPYVDPATKRQMWSISAERFVPVQAAAGGTQEK